LGLWVGIQNTFDDAATGLAVAITAAWYGWRMIFVTAGVAIKEMWLRLWEELSLSWLTFSSGIQRGWARVKAFVTGSSADAQVAAINAEEAAQRQQIESARGNRQNDAASEVERLRREGMAVIGQIEAENRRDQQRRQQWLDGQQAVADDEIAAQQAELDALIARAGTAAEQARLDRLNKSDLAT